jgi:sulfoxide reductase heme-binding subunit YedZ
MTMNRPLLRRFPLLLRIATHVGALIPLAVLVRDFLTHHLTENPIQAAEQRTGTIALVLLLVSLACTPLNTLFRFSQAIRRRRALGLYAFFYASLHLFIFAVIDFGLDWPTLWEMVSEKRYIIAGLATFVILVALAVTSFRWWMKRMGKGWKRLHQLIYLAGALAILHLAWVVKGSVSRLNGDIRRPIAYGSVLALLLVLRIPAVRRAVVRARQSILNRGIFSHGIFSRGIFNRAIVNRPPADRPIQETDLVIDKPRKKSATSS